MKLSLEWRQSFPGLTVAEIKGYLTMGNDLREVEHLLVRFLEQRGAKLVLDLRDVEMVDSAGVTTLAVCAQASDRYGGQVAIASPSPRARKVFEITHLAQVMPIHEDLESAAESFRA
jgi:anti-anti-sigma factor